MKLTELAKRKAQHVICFGDPKSGKSELVGKLATKFKLLWFSIDNGHDVLFKLPQAAQENIEIVVLPDTKDYPIAIETLLKVFTGAPLEICVAHGKVACMLCKKDSLPSSHVCLSNLSAEHIVCVDHISQVADSAMNHITKDQPDTFKPGYTEFRIQGTLMSKILTNIQQASYHVCCIAHCAETEMEDGKKKIVPLVGSIPFSRNSGKYFDHMVHFDVRNAKHVFGSATTYIPNIVTGSRSDIAIESMKEISLIPFFSGEAAVPAAAPTAGQTALKSIASMGGVKK